MVFLVSFTLRRKLETDLLMQSGAYSQTEGSLVRN